MRRILVIHGPNLNLLGIREPSIYGTLTLPGLDQGCAAWGDRLGVEVETVQTNHEGAIIDAIQEAGAGFDGIVLNPGAFAHTSYAIADAVAASRIPTVEVHISNIRDREPYRARSVIEPAAVYQIFGRGVEGYRWAMWHLVHRAALPFSTLAYGAHSDQVGDLRVPPGTETRPLVVLFHGGYWRDLWTRDLMDGMAVDLSRRGYATWNVEYRRIPPIGGWRSTLADAVAALDHVSEIAMTSPCDPGNVTLIGHSAGALLALLAATRSERISPSRVVSLAGVLDLAALHDPEDPQNGPHRFLGTEATTVIPAASPIEQVPVGVPQLIVHGSHDEDVPQQVSRSYAERAARAGDDVETMWLDGVDHMDLIDPDSAAWAQITEGL